MPSPGLDTTPTAGDSGHADGTTTSHHGYAATVLNNLDLPNFMPRGIYVNTLANRPAADAAFPGRMYYASDLDQAFIDDGGTWHPVALPDQHTYFTSGRPWVDIVGSGADPTGSADSSSYITAANALGYPLYIPDGTFKIDTSTTISVPLILNGELAVQAGDVLTITGPVTILTDTPFSGAGTVTWVSPTVASANPLTLPARSFGDVINVSGVTSFSSLTLTGTAGRIVTLIFQGSLTVSESATLIMPGPFYPVAGDTLTLASNGTAWYEVSRSPNSWAS